MLYRRGEFQVLLFGDYGNKTGKQEASSNQAATKIAQDHMALAKGNSAVINRTIWNSKDNDNKWDYIP